MDNSMSIFEAKRKRIEIISFWECTRVWTLAAQNQQLLWEWCKRVKRKENVESEKMQRKIERNKENKREGKKKWKREKWCKVKSEVWADRKIQKEMRKTLKWMDEKCEVTFSDSLSRTISRNRFAFVYFSISFLSRFQVLFLCLSTSSSLLFRYSLGLFDAPFDTNSFFLSFSFSITLSDVINVSRMCVTVAPPTCSQISLNPPKFTLYSSSKSLCY